jgi:hypothetical protein
MIILGPLLVIVGIGFFCWLLFNLAVFALPFFVGLMIGIWAFHTGAGVLGGIAVGLVADGVTFGIGQLALAFVPWAWLRLLIILLYVAPATVAGYSATHGIAQMAMPSPTWQMIFAVFGAIAVSVTAFVRAAAGTESCEAGTSGQDRFSAMSIWRLGLERATRCGRFGRPPTAASSDYRLPHDALASTISRKSP